MRVAAPLRRVAASRSVARTLLHWAEMQQPGWVEQHVDTYINIAGPMLGVPKAVTAVLSGAPFLLAPHCSTAWRRGAMPLPCACARNRGGVPLRGDAGHGSAGHGGVVRDGPRDAPPPARPALPLLGLPAGHDASRGRKGARVQLHALVAQPRASGQGPGVCVRKARRACGARATSPHKRTHANARAGVGQRHVGARRHASPARRQPLLRRLHHLHEGHPTATSAAAAAGREAGRRQGAGNARRRRPRVSRRRRAAGSGPADRSRAGHRAPGRQPGRRRGRRRASGRHPRRRVGRVG